MAVPHTHFLYTELEWVYECMNEKKKKKKTNAAVLLPGVA